MGQEVARINARGYYDGIGGGTYIGRSNNFGFPSSSLASLKGLPPILNFGKPAIRDKISNEVFDGKKLVCLAISEAFAGSDVAGLKCHAKRVDNGWVVTGT
jgi:alkylation response protein AidB-like acyl-CoA dehydrogenase